MGDKTRSSILVFDFMTFDFTTFDLSSLCVFV
jgi:hypothetical protein